MLPLVDMEYRPRGQPGQGRPRKSIKVLASERIFGGGRKRKRKRKSTGSCQLHI
jgi:hypothetical protein